MTTASWSTRIRHDSDATYQEWRDELITKLGLMVTASKLAADETNITPGAGARAGTNSEQGYAVYHIADTLHGTAPVYIRFGFGTGGGTTSPRLQITTGTSTNGSGVLGGTALSTIASIGRDSAQTTDTARQSYLCVVAGFLGLGHKYDTSASPGTTGAGYEGTFWICRSCDSDGVPTATASIAHWGIGTSGGFTKRQGFRYAATAAAYTTTTTVSTGALGLSPQSPVATVVGADVQVALGWMITPRVAPIFAMCGVYAGELSRGGTFTATLVGTTARTFLTIYSTAGPFGPAGISPAAGDMHQAMLWE